MPTFRPDIREIAPYLPGRSIAEVARENGFEPDEIVKLASNESPLPPIEPVQARIREHVEAVFRYPDNEAAELRQAIAHDHGMEPDQVCVGGGSSELLRVIALAVGGPGTSAVYAWPSFVIYRLASMLSMSDRIEVPLVDHHHDLDALVAAIRDDTTVVYVCNPNNPTGTILSAGKVADFVEQIPERVLVVIDEAYHEYVTDPAHATAVPLAIERPNVVVTRTFSKIHGLAALRVGYAIALPDTITELRKAQAPFTVTSLGQAAAIESLRHSDEIGKRAAENAVERERVAQELNRMGISVVPSQTNFLFFAAPSVPDPAAAYLRHGIIVRVLGGGVRVTIGTPDENDRFVEASRTIVA